MLVCAAMLALVIDVSRSIDADEYRLQMQGTAQVFASERLVRAINPEQPLAVSVVIFGDSAIVSVPWTLLRTPQDSLRLSARITAIQNPDHLYTNIIGGIGTALDLYNTAPCESENKVIDVSADGIHNAGTTRPQDTIQGVVQRAQEMNIRINTLPIDPNSPNTSLEEIYDYYNTNFALPTGGFTIRAYGFQDFARAIYNKITTEIASR